MKVDEKFCAAFNTVRSNNVGKEFNREELSELLVNGVPGFSKQSHIISFLVKSHIILKEGGKRHTVYKFTATPVHIATLSEVIFSLKKYNNERNKKYNDNKRKAKKVQSIQAPQSYKQIDEEYCIKFLKERGYRIMKQIINFEEV